MFYHVSHFLSVDHTRALRSVGGYVNSKTKVTVFDSSSSGFSPPPRHQTSGWNHRVFPCLTPCGLWSLNEAQQ